MSVFRQGQPLEQIDHLVCIKRAVGTDASQMILHARLHDATVLVGLQSGEAIIKPYKEGDETLRFEDFYDTAISVHEYHKMERQKVLTREELAPHLFELELLLIEECPISIRLRLKAKHRSDVPAIIHNLVREDKDFGTGMHSRFVMAMLRSESGSIEPQEPLQISDAAPTDAPDWEFVKRA